MLDQFSKVICLQSCVFLTKHFVAQIFKGNKDTDTPVTHNFAEFGGPFNARYVKIHPVTWNDHICMRADMIVEDRKLFNNTNKH